MGNSNPHKENSEMYKKAFTLMFDTCKSDEPSYDVHKNLQGIVVNWMTLNVPVSLKSWVQI